MSEKIDALMTQLEDSLHRLTWAMMDVDEEDLNASEGDEWSPIEILAHVKACDDIITSRIAMLLVHPKANLQDFNERAWAEIAGYVDAPLDQTLMALQRHRNEMIWQLRRLPDEAWERTAPHETRGTLSLFDLVKSFADHETDHVQQLENLFEDVEQS
jgi:hypothetical protein